MSIGERISNLDWNWLVEEIDRQGWATTRALLTDTEREALIAGYADLEQKLAGKATLVPLANRWREALGAADSFPSSFEQYIMRCHEAGQTRPTPLILRYGPGDYNCLHQDLYGELNFPLQAAFLLSELGKDFAGGEFVLTEQRPRMQSRVQVVPLEAGEAVIFAVNHRPVQGTRGTYRVAMRHGVSPLREGRRHALGIILHDAA